MTDGQDHVLSQADALTKKIKTIDQFTLEGPFLPRVP